MRVECAWHKKYFPKAGVFVITEGKERGQQVSHGMCHRCVKRFMKENKKVMEVLNGGK